MGGKSSKQTTESKPPEWAMPLFKMGASEGMRLYESGSGGNVYQGSTVSPLSSTTMSGVNQLANAGANWDTGATRGTFAGLGGAAVSDPFVNKLNTTASRMGSLSTNLGPTSSATNLKDMASGKWLNPDTNPYGEQVLGKALDDTAARVKSTMAGQGRYGSKFSLSTLGDTLGDQANEFRYNDYNDNLTRMLGANAQIDAANSTNYQNKLAGLTGQAQGYAGAGALRGQGLDRAMDATKAMYGIDQQNFTNRLTGADATLNAGKILDTQAQRELSDDVAKWYANDNRDWQRLGMLLGTAQGSAGNYGTTNQTTRQPMDVGSLMTGFGALLGKSDVRAKENIIAIGRMNGLTIYDFSYTGGSERYRGIMAQELPIWSDALIIDEDGTYSVNYAKVGFPMLRVG